MAEQSQAAKEIFDVVERLRGGDVTARDSLLQLAEHRLMKLTRKMKRGYERLNRWEQTEDVLQNALLRLHQSLADVQINDVAHFFRLAATQIRRELIDLSRHYHGANGLGRNHQTLHRDPDANMHQHALDPAEVSRDPHRLQAWEEFHGAIEHLPAKEREVIDYLWYHGLSHADVAQLMEVSERQVRRLWRSAKLLLHDRLHDELPGK